MTRPSARLVLLIGLGVVALVTEGASNPTVSPESSHKQRRLKADSTTYYLISYARKPLPAKYVGFDKCEYEVVAGWYRLFRDRFESFDSTLAQCPPQSPAKNRSGRWVGGLHHRKAALWSRGDTLTFDVYAEDVHDSVAWDEGVVRGDTLFTGIFHEGHPDRVYVRR